MREVPRVPASELDEHRRARRPVVLTDLADAWPARSRWSIDHLANTYGDVRVPVARTRGGAVVTDSGRGLTFTEAKLRDAVAAITGPDPAGYVMAPLDDLPSDLARDAPRPPCCAQAPWYVAKLWISSPGTTTALHFDVADNLHTVLSGQKRFILVSARESLCVYPRGITSDLPNGANVDPEAPDLQRYPRFAGAHPMVADVGPGDTLFIPGRCWHHVRTVELTLAVNAWWAEGALALAARAADAFKRARGLSR